MSNPPARLEAGPTVATFVAFMTAWGTAQQVLKTRMVAAHGEPGLGPLHLHALCICQRNPGFTQQQLAQSLGRDKGQMARLIRELEERQLLQRSADERDRRVWRLNLTPAGDQQCQWFQALEATMAQDLLGHLAPEETAALLAAMHSVQARMESWGSHA
jgi:DNA-binding MarR family transcriptional regulator